MRMQNLYKERSNSRAESRGGRDTNSRASSRASIGLNDSDSNYSFLSSAANRGAKRHPSRNRFFTPKVIKDLPMPVLPEPEPIPSTPLTEAQVIKEFYKEYCDVVR